MELGMRVCVRCGIGDECVCEVWNWRCVCV